MPCPATGDSGTLHRSLFRRVYFDVIPALDQLDGDNFSAFNYPGEGESLKDDGGSDASLLGRAEKRARPRLYVRVPSRIEKLFRVF